MGNTVIRVKERIREFAEYLPEIENEDSDIFQEQIVNRLKEIDAMSMDCPEYRNELMDFCFNICADELDNSVIQHHSRHKPFGYAGDYLIIDWIHQYKIHSLSGRGQLWDKAFQSQSASVAVRNRKEFFTRTLSALCEQFANGMSVLNLASGPCRDLVEAADYIGDKSDIVSFHCVDMDARAVNYARKVVEENQPEIDIQWQVANAFKIQPTSRYDLVWSAGLFDYLNERCAVLLLKKMWSWADEGGTVIVGNFHPSNSSRNYMEWCGQWFLEYRSEEDMLALCDKAQIPLDYVILEQEPLGACIFLVAKKPD
ncbi:class I SAM-dependent methyltransferase [Chloroflexota bacterium]